MEELLRWTNQQTQKVTSYLSPSLSLSLSSIPHPSSLPLFLSSSHQVDVTVTDFTSSFKSGEAFCALMKGINDDFPYWNTQHGDIGLAGKRPLSFSLFLILSLLSCFRSLFLNLTRSLYFLLS